MTDIKVKLLFDDAIVPTRGTEYSAGFDLYSHLEDEEVWIQPNETKKIGTGIATAIPEGWFGGIFARSGLATKQGLRPANCVGVIDSDYRGEVIVAIHNDSDKPQCIKNNDRIAQLVVIPFWDGPIVVKEDLDETERGEGGFGSTGVNDSEFDAEHITDVLIDVGQKCAVSASEMIEAFEKSSVEVLNPNGTPYNGD